MTQIIKQFETETAHIVRNAVSERCRFNIHGHSYRWEVAIVGPVNEDTGMVLDFKQLGDIKGMIDKFDHATVFWSQEEHGIIDFFEKNFKRVIVMKKNPTAENMARYAVASTQKWLDWFDRDHISEKMGEKRYFCSYARIWETRNGSAQSSEFDSQDVLTYVHEEK